MGGLRGRLRTRQSRCAREWWRAGGRSAAIERRLGLLSRLSRLSLLSLLSRLGLLGLLGLRGLLGGGGRV